MWFLISDISLVLRDHDDLRGSCFRVQNCRFTDANRIIQRRNVCQNVLEFGTESEETAGTSAAVPNVPWCRFKLIHLGFNLLVYLRVFVFGRVCIPPLATIVCTRSPDLLISFHCAHRPDPLRGFDKNRNSNEIDADHIFLYFFHRCNFSLMDPWKSGEVLAIGRVMLA